MLLYHSYESNGGFNLKKMDWDRGLFALDNSELNQPEYKNYSKFTPNEFGDVVVELDIDDNVKTIEDVDQLDLLKKLFPNSKNVDRIIKKFSYESAADVTRDDWHKLDSLIGKELKKRGYKLIHYTAENNWAILDKNIIKKIRRET